VRNNALFSIGQSGAPNRVSILEGVYRNSMDNTRIRQQVLVVLNQTREPHAVTLIGNIASTDPDMEVRRQAVHWLRHSNTAEAQKTLDVLYRRR
jgi:hypothetical protein